MLINIINLIKGLFMSVGSYSNTVFPDPLSPIEETDAINKMLNGDKDSRNKLIEHNLRLVAHIVKKYEAKDKDIFFIPV